MKSNRGSGVPMVGRIAFALAVSFATLAHAEWSSDPAANLIVADDAGGASQPHVAAAPDGGFYISWNSAGADGYDIRLQRLDASGNELWPHGGVLVADRNYSFTYDYGLAVDSVGNAYLSFNCCVNNSPTEHITVNKVTPDGVVAWGANGITLQNGDTEHVYVAYVTVASDDRPVVAWMSDSGGHVQKLDASGALLWGATGMPISQPVGAKFIADIEPSLNGDVIVSWSNQAGSARIQYAQRFDSTTGAGVWSSAVRVFGQGNLQAGYFPKFQSDGAGGGVFAEYDIIGTTFYVRAQHIDANGNVLLDPNGVLATTDTGIQHGLPAAAFDPATGNIYVVWRDYQNVGGVGYDGLSAQRIDATGARMWSETGKVLVPLTDSNNSVNTISQLTALAAGSDVIFGWTTGTYPAPDEPITTVRLDPEGDAAWPTQTVVLRTNGITARTSVARSSGGFAAYVFEDGNASAGGPRIAAQNLLFDGGLGHIGPAVPGAPMLDTGSDSGASNSDGITNAATLLFHGSCEQDGDQIQLFDAGDAIGSAVACSAGAYAASVDAPAEGVHAISATTTRGGLASAQSATQAITVDRTAPAAPVVTSPTPPVSAPFTLAGNAEPFAAITVMQGAGTVCTTAADAAGAWNCAIASAGSDAFGITATDVAGNTGPSASWSPGVDEIFSDGFDG